MRQIKNTVSGLNKATKITLVVMLIYFVIFYGIGFLVPLPVKNDEMTSLEVHKVWIKQVILNASCILGFLGLALAAFFELRNPHK